MPIVAAKPTPTKTALVSENRQLRRDLKRYEELLDTYQAIANVDSEKRTGRLKKLKSLADLM